MSNFRDNVPRLLGLHRMRANVAKQVVGISVQTLSEWQYGKREPSLDSLLKLEAFFEIPGTRLLNAEFADLLAHELADADTRAWRRRSLD
jgi:transcriptional regulator with XRE-family HTH domain